MTIEMLNQKCAAIIFERFKEYETRFRQITLRAPKRFQNRHWALAQADANERLNLYEIVISQATQDIRNLLEDRFTEEEIWIGAKNKFANLISQHPNQELARTTFNSVTRRIHGTVGINMQFEFVQDDGLPSSSQTDKPIFKTYPLGKSIETTILDILNDHKEFQLDKIVLNDLLPHIVARIGRRIPDHDQLSHIEMIPDVFFRGQGAFLIGRIIKDRGVIPLVMALVHGERGLVLDAVLLDADGVSILFSYTRSAFHTLTKNPQALVQFLKSIMPAKPEAEIYSSIGYFKHGKTVLFREICHYSDECTEDKFRISAGKRGMVMVVFDMAGFEMVFKLIRDFFDTPKKTTRSKVMDQYDFVFNHYKVGRLIEAHAFEHLSFDRCMFTDELLDYLVAEAGQTVHFVNDHVVIDHAYLERRVTPLDIYLKQVDDDKAISAVIDLGNAIKDLAYANIFPGDLLLKNFGVTRHGRVVFYDYDEILPLTECRFRKIPLARNHMEEMADEPWYMVEEGDVFPEQFSRFLGLPPHYYREFMNAHADLLSPDFWVMAQEKIRQGYIQHVRPYLDKYRLQYNRQPDNILSGN